MNAVVKSAGFRLACTSVGELGILYVASMVWVSVRGTLFWTRKTGYRRAAFRLLVEVSNGACK